VAGLIDHLVEAGYRAAALGPTVVDMYLAELAAHAWDLARAT
jgi:hypothetical protein